MVMVRRQPRLTEVEQSILLALYHWEYGAFRIVFGAYQPPTCFPPTSRDLDGTKCSVRSASECMLRAAMVVDGAELSSAEFASAMKTLCGLRLVATVASPLSEDCLWSGVQVVSLPTPDELAQRQAARHDRFYPYSLWRVADAVKGQVTRSPLFIRTRAQPQDSERYIDYPMFSAEVLDDENDVLWTFADALDDPHFMLSNSSPVCKIF